jgi:hypothetical protein
MFDFIRECCCFNNQNTIKNELPATFVSLKVFVYSAILALNLPCRFADSYGPPCSVYPSRS